MAPDSLVRMGHLPNRVEIMTTVSGVSFDDCWRDRIDDVWDGMSVHILSLADLKDNTRTSGRAKDLADLDELP